MIIENRDALLKSGKLPKKNWIPIIAEFWYVPVLAVLPLVPKKFIRKCWNCARI